MVTIACQISSPSTPEKPPRSRGTDRAHDAFGSPIGQVVAMREGEKLPPLPFGFTWFRMEKW